MKLIEALKKIKALSLKTDDLRKKIGLHSAYLSFETPVYKDQKSQVDEWLQAHSDVLKEILKLRIGIQKTNLAVNVTIDLGDKPVTKSIAEWIHRRRDLATEECTAWRKLTDRGLKEGKVKQSTGEELDVKIVRCYEPKVRDAKIDLYSNEAYQIDSKLEITNAVTDLIE